MEQIGVFEIWDRFEASSVTELELETMGFKLRLKKGGEIAKISEEKPAIKVLAKSKAPEPKEDGILVRAALVGTFYQAPSPEDAPFVTPGQAVKKGDVVGIIEAMKLMNEITAPEDGVVREILVSDGEMVEYGQVLLVMDKEA